MCLKMSSTFRSNLNKIKLFAKGLYWTASRSAGVGDIVAMSPCVCSLAAVHKLKCITLKTLKDAGEEM